MMQAANQFGANAGVQWLNQAEFDLNGKNQTVAGISDSEGHGVIENQHPWYADPGANATLTVNNVADCYYNGVIYDGGGYGRTLAIVKSGAGKLTLGGNAYGLDNGWTGGTTISGGTLQIGDGATNAVLARQRDEQRHAGLQRRQQHDGHLRRRHLRHGRPQQSGRRRADLGRNGGQHLFRRHHGLQWQTRAGQDRRLCHPRRFHDRQRQHLRGCAKRESVPQHGRGDLVRFRQLRISSFTATA